jgi:hypothetical protein
VLHGSGDWNVLHFVTASNTAAEVNATEAVTKCNTFVPLQELTALTGLQPG